MSAPDERPIQLRVANKKAYVWDVEGALQSFGSLAVCSCSIQGRRRTDTLRISAVRRTGRDTASSISTERIPWDTISSPS